jgi:hypothetical protein
VVVMPRTPPAPLPTADEAVLVVMPRLPPAPLAVVLDELELLEAEIEELELLEGELDELELVVGEDEDEDEDVVVARQVPVRVKKSVEVTHQPSLCHTPRARPILRALTRPRTWRWISCAAGRRHRRTRSVQGVPAVGLHPAVHLGEVGAQQDVLDGGTQAVAPAPTRPGGD